MNSGVYRLFGTPFGIKITPPVRHYIILSNKWGAVHTYTLGIISALVFGMGMCLAMGQIGSGTTSSFVLGIAIGVVGMIGMGVNYPIHKKLLAQGKQKYAFEIMELAKEISER